MAWSFKPGDLVVCVDVSDTGPWNIDWEASEALTKGAVYTITRVYVDEDDDLTVQLRERKRVAAAQASGVCGYLASRFRPVNPNSIASLRAILNEHPVSAPRIREGA